MYLSDIHLRDPFILPYEGTYYLYGTRGSASFGPGSGLDVYTSTDLVHWSEPQECFTIAAGFWADRDLWAPEVHVYHGHFYMLVSLKAEGVCRGTQILRAEDPRGPFLPISEGPVTPRDWECLDGTLYLDASGQPYIVFCHEWCQIQDGAMCYAPLSDDLTHMTAAPRDMFHASEPAWSTVPGWAAPGAGTYVTDGPFPYRTAEGRLLLLWSSFSQGKYLEAQALSESGTLAGPWRHDTPLLSAEHGGHGMIFSGFDGRQYFVMHRPNSPAGLERPTICPVEEKDGFLSLVTEEK